MKNIIADIQAWSTERGLNKQAPAKQLLKLVEEVGELSAAYNKRHTLDEIDSVGDILVVLTIYCQQRGLSIEDCLEAAYEEISERKGKMIDGVFVKNADLGK